MSNLGTRLAKLEASSAPNQPDGVKGLAERLRAHMGQRPAHAPRTLQELEARLSEVPPGGLASRILARRIHHLTQGLA